jgi:hypothetical protein
VPDRLILKIIIHTRALRLGHALLPLIHFRNHPTRTRLLRLLIISQLDESGKPQTDALSIRARELARCGLVAGGERQISCFDFPDQARLEPDVRLVLVARGVDIERFRPVNDILFKLGVEFFENGFGEPSTDITHGLVVLGGGVVAGKEECTIP